MILVYVLRSLSLNRDIVSLVLWIKMERSRLPYVGRNWVLFFFFHLLSDGDPSDMETILLTIFSLLGLPDENKILSTNDTPKFKCLRIKLTYHLQWLSLKEFTYRNKLF